MTLGQPCQVENTPYIGYAGTDEFIDIVSRGNCRVGMYCDSQQTVCVQAKQLTEGCSADKESVALVAIIGYLSLTAVTQVCILQLLELRRMWQSCRSS